MIIASYLKYYNRTEKKDKTVFWIVFNCGHGLFFSLVSLNPNDFVLNLVFIANFMNFWNILNSYVPNKDINFVPNASLSEGILLPLIFSSVEKTGWFFKRRST